MALNKNLSDNFFCDYFKWLFHKRKKREKRNPDIISHMCLCVCVATSVMETQLIIKIGHFTNKQDGIKSANTFRRLLVKNSSKQCF